MHYEMQAHVYSVVTFRNGDDQDRLLKAYLYEHTKLHEGFDLPSISDCRMTAVILRTTVTQTYNERCIGIDGLNENGETPVRELIRRAFYLARYQSDRLCSGLHTSRVCGSLFEAETYVTELETRFA